MEWVTVSFIILYDNEKFNIFNEKLKKINKKLLTLILVYAIIKMFKELNINTVLG